jgi:hypothetical protein
MLSIKASFSAIKAARLPVASTEDAKVGALFGRDGGAWQDVKRMQVETIGRKHFV